MLQYFDRLIELRKVTRLLATVALLGCALTAAMRFGYALPTFKPWADGDLRQ